MFKRTVAKAKMDYIINLNDSLSNPKNKAALYKFMASNRAVSIKKLQSSEVLTSAEEARILERSARGLAVRFSSRCNNFRLIGPPETDDFMPVSSCDLTEALSITRSAAPGLDGVTVGAIKFLAEEFQPVLLNVINSSLRFC